MLGPRSAPKPDWTWAGGQKHSEGTRWPGATGTGWEPEVGWVPGKGILSQESKGAFF